MKDPCFYSRVDAFPALNVKLRRILWVRQRILPSFSCSRPSVIQRKQHHRCLFTRSRERERNSRERASQSLPKIMKLILYSSRFVRVILAQVAPGSLQASDPHKSRTLTRTNRELARRSRHKSRQPSPSPPPIQVAFFNDFLL